VELLDSLREMRGDQFAAVFLGGMFAAFFIILFLNWCKKEEHL